MKRILFSTVILTIMAGTFTAGTVEAQQNVPFDTQLWLTNPAGDPVEPEWLGYCLAQGYDAAFQGTRTGTATHLGKLVSMERGCLDFSLFPVVQSRNIEMRFIAANGDELTGMAEGDFDFTQNPPRVIWASFVFTGGTGRFENATGGGESFGLSSVLRHVGIISYKASNRGGH
jgi:hypothetical protein